MFSFFTSVLPGLLSLVSTFLSAQWVLDLFGLFQDPAVLP